MYLNAQQMAAVLDQPLFSLPVTTTTYRYTLYRRRTNVAVITVRFNMQRIPNSTLAQFMRQQLMETLLESYELGQRLLCLVDYDLLLEQQPPNNSSFYCWRANSNSAAAAVATVDREQTITLSYQSIYQLVQQSLAYDLDSLDTQFANSNVTINRVLAIVLSFVPV